MSMFKWEVVDPAPGEAVAPHQRLAWGKTVGLGAQHVVAMFGATFVFPLVMGLDANLAIMFSGLCTILFLLICQNKVPSYLGTSASFVGSVAAIRALDTGNDSSYVTGAILVGGLVLAAIGVLVHFGGASLIHRVLPPAVTGAVVMLIGFNLAPVVAGIYWPQDQWVALLTATFMVVAAVMLPGFWSRIAVFLALVFGYLLSWVFDAVFGPITSVLGGATEATTHDRVTWAGVQAADWIGLPSGQLADGVDVVHGPSFSLVAILLVLPGVIALVAENTGHVKAVAEMTGEDLDPYMGRAIGADGLATAFAVRVRRLADHDVRREHRRHGSDPGLLDRRLLRGGPGRDPARPVPEVRRGRQRDAGRGARRDHRGPVRHDRTGGSEDLGREQRRLRRPRQPGRPGRRHHRRRRQTSPWCSPTTSSSPASRSARSS